MSSPKAAAHLPETPLGKLERLVERALERGRGSDLRCSVHHEISPELGWPPHAPAFA